MELIKNFFSRIVEKDEMNLEYKKDFSIINPFQVFQDEKGEFKNYNPFNFTSYYSCYGDLMLEKYKQLLQIEKSKYLLCYFMICNKNNFKKVGENFIVEKKDHFYYVIMNDLDNLKKLYEENKYIIIEKDHFYRNLLHFAVIGEYYEICKFLLENGINYDEADIFQRTPLYYAKGEIKDLISSYGATITFFNMHKIIKGINIKYYDNHKIELLYNDFINKGLISHQQLIKKNNEIIAKRFIRFKTEEYEESKTWVPVYHGTKFVSMEHILLFGLTTFGEPLKGHIPLGEKNDNIDNWAAAVFVSPSIFYASEYSDIINTDNENWFIIIEAKIKPGSYTTHKSTIYNYNKRNGEPENIEYRIESEKKIGSLHFILDHYNIYTYSLLFIKKNYLDNIKNYNEFSI